MCLLNSEQRIAELVPLIEGEAPEIFWPIFLGAWPVCDKAYGWNYRLVEKFRRVGSCPPEMLDDDSKEFYDDLPNKIEVYRGASRSRIDGAISWTTDRKIAERFARGHRGIAVPDPVIATGIIRKAQIFAAINDRQENEVLCLPKIIETRPVKLAAVREEKPECNIAERAAE